ncbi:MAG: hypothetical protein R6U68_03705 [Desulfobacteraceae bacterium]
MLYGSIVLDNYQTVGEEAQLHEVLCNAIDILQGKISIIICSRTEPSAAFVRACIDDSECYCYTIVVKKG